MWFSVILQNDTRSRLFWRVCVYVLGISQNDTMVLRLLKRATRTWFKRLGFCKSSIKNKAKWKQHITSSTFCMIGHLEWINTDTFIIIDYESVVAKKGQLLPRIGSSDISWWRLKQSLLKKMNKFYRRGETTTKSRNMSGKLRNIAIKYLVYSVIFGAVLVVAFAHL